MGKGERTIMDSPLVTMIMHASWAAKLVLFILLLFSVITWMIIVSRLYFIKSAEKGNRSFKKQFDQLDRLAELDQMDKKMLLNPLGRLGSSGVSEFNRIMADMRRLGSRDPSFMLQSQFSMAEERLESASTGIVSTLDRGVFLLAIVSSISPFLGLLGTVWGIMNSFFEIGNQGSASLPVVAPGIAEALIATLAGLAVAIPALFFYNYFNHRAERIETDVDEFKTMLLARIKREALLDLYDGRGSA
jgi:biopolymer transport protein TolQ